MRPRDVTFDLGHVNNKTKISFLIVTSVSTHDVFNTIIVILKCSAFSGKCFLRLQQWYLPFAWQLTMSFSEKKFHCKEYNFIYHVFWELFLKFTTVMSLFCATAAKHSENLSLTENIKSVIAWYANNKNSKLHMYYSLHMAHISIYVGSFMCLL